MARKSSISNPSPTPWKKRMNAARMQAQCDPLCVDPAGQRPLNHLPEGLIGHLGARIAGWVGWGWGGVGGWGGTDRWMDGWMDGCCCALDQPRSVGWWQREPPPTAPSQTPQHRHNPHPLFPLTLLPPPPPLPPLPKRQPQPQPPPPTPPHPPVELHIWGQQALIVERKQRRKYLLLGQVPRRPQHHYAQAAVLPVVDLGAADARVCVLCMCVCVCVCVCCVSQPNPTQPPRTPPAPVKCHSSAPGGCSRCRPGPGLQSRGPPIRHRRGWRCECRRLTRLMLMRCLGAGVEGLQGWGFGVVECV